ncbi:hypothetical protein T484DRAFT_1768684, partial [Baffinella frigidus]
MGGVQEFATEKRHLEQRAAMADKALEAARAELEKAQHERFESGRIAEQRLREQADALAMAHHLLHTQAQDRTAQDKTVRISELERAVKQIEFHQRAAAAAKEEAASHITRVAALQARVHASAQSVPSKSEMLITTMSEQIEALAAQVEKLEALLVVAEAAEDGRIAAAATVRAAEVAKDAAERAAASAREKAASLQAPPPTPIGNNPFRGEAEEVMLVRGDAGETLRTLSAEHAASLSAVREHAAETARVLERMRLERDQVEQRSRVEKETCDELRREVDVERGARSAAEKQARAAELGARASRDQ